MADVPLIFLSHSGAQKDFTRRLYLELAHVGHRAFFDEDAQDSLPKGQPFPPRILQACRGCKMGIVVLSPEYLQSLWPMLELEQLTFHNPSPHCILYPLFHSVPPADLSNKNKLRQWQDTWDSNALKWQSRVDSMKDASTSQPQISIDISSWLEALKKLRDQSGDVFKPHIDEHAYIQTVVSNICKTIPPPRARYLLDEHIKGRDRMQQVIDDLFNQQASQNYGNSTGAMCLGVWGLGGSGKTTLCKNMANFYRKDFPGRSCMLALPTEQNEKQLVEAVREVILTLGRAKNDEIEKISSVDMIMSYLEDGLKGRPLFLAIDNVWDWTIERATQIVSMACTLGSKILVTSRSKQVLEMAPLPWKKIFSVPSITEEEATEVLKSCFSLPYVILPEIEDLKALARLCFFEGHCHPLLLKTMGDKLRHRGGRMNDEQGWKDLISRLRTRPMKDEENIILQVLETSLLALTPTLQNTFIDLVTCVSEWYIDYNKRIKRFKRLCKWLSMIHDGLSTEMDMRDQLFELEYRGLLEIKEIKEDDWRSDRGISPVIIHDLHKSVARRRAAGRDACLFDVDGRQLSDLSIDHAKYIIFSNEIFEASSYSNWMRVLTHCSKLEILILISWDESMWWRKRGLISVRSMQYLRVLELHECTSLKEIEGWEGTPNLVSVQLCQCWSLQKLGDMGCLQKLEKLVISESPLLGDGFLKNLPSHKLKKLKLPSSSMKDVSTACTLTALRKLNFSRCARLEIMGDHGIVCHFTDLEELDLTDCSKLKTIPDLTNLGRLKVFRANGCSSLEMVKLGVFAVTSLQFLELPWCSLGQLSRLPSGSLSTGLALALCDAGDANTDYGSRSSQPLLHRSKPLINGLGPFVNLKELRITGDQCSNTASLELSGMTSLEECHLISFRSLRDIRVRSSLAKLRKLELWKCPLLMEITGLDALPKLRGLIIRDCSYVERFLGSGEIMAGSTDDAAYNQQALHVNASNEGHSSTAQVPAAVFPGCLEVLSIQGCSSLTTLPPLPVAVRRLSLQQCASLMDLTSLTSPLPFLRYLDLGYCSSLRAVPNLTHLTSLKEIHLPGSLALYTQEVQKQMYKIGVFVHYM